MWPPSAAIFFMTNFYRARGGTMAAPWIRYWADIPSPRQTPLPRRRPLQLWIIVAQCQFGIRCVFSTAVLYQLCSYNVIGLLSLVLFLMSVTKFLMSFKIFLMLSIAACKVHKSLLSTLFTIP